MDQLENLSIPPLDPTWWRDTGLPTTLSRIEARPIHQEIIFKLSLESYMRRMEHEGLRLARERHLEKTLEEKTRIIESLANQVKCLQTVKMPSLAALRQAYVEDVITLEEFDRLILHYIAGME